MATLSDLDRQRISIGLQRYWSQIRERCNFLKLDVINAVIATDDWIDSNQSSYNLALPTNFRINATAEQKTLLFCGVALARTSIELLKRVFGEVD